MELESLSIHRPASSFRKVRLGRRTPRGVRKKRWDRLTEEEKEEKFAPLCPEFVVELRSRSQKSKKKLQKKCERSSHKEPSSVG